MKRIFLLLCFIVPLELFALEITDISNDSGYTVITWDCEPYTSYIIQVGSWYDGEFIWNDYDWVYSVAYSGPYTSITQYFPPNTYESLVFRIREYEFECWCGL